MNRAVIIGLLLLLGSATPHAQQTNAPVDFNKARILFERRQRGETLTSDEQAYLERARSERRKRPGQSANQRPAPERLTPLTDMSANDRYEGEDGGLYGSGRNTPPDAHRKAAEVELAKIRPRNAEGQADDEGIVGFVAISMSNATQEFSRFKQVADRSPLKSPKVVIVDCAQGGQAMAEWAPADARPWDEARRRLAAAKVSLRQVQVAWIKLANKGPTGSLQEHGHQLERDTLAVLHNAKTQFPNLRIVYLGSRTYGGYAIGGLNPEPYAYESAFAARWLIRRQMQGDAELALTRSPLLLWGPYLWAEGTKGRQVDSLVWARTDFGADGVHPSDSGRQKVAELLLKFLTTDPLAKPWFTVTRGPAAAADTGEEPSPILVNHVGFTPQAAKHCLIPGSRSVAYEVIDTATGQAAFTGRTTPGGPDLGAFQVGDFSGLNRPGTFQVRAGDTRSGSFRIASDVYDDALRKTVSYFAKQRCGPSDTGYHAPCHLDDGRRRDNGQHQDVTGGWHDACDLRKWVDATIFGMIGLARVAELRQPDWGRAAVPAELRWGNRYFLAMQEPAGYVMNYCGGNDGNRWTGNQVGDQDDRPIHTEPCNATAQFCFILAQAATVRLTQEADPTSATRGREAALRCLAWCRTNNAGRTSTDLGAAVAACVELHRTFGADQFRTLTAEYAQRLLALQVTERGGGEGAVRGFFRASPTDAEPRRDISHGCWQLIGLCEALEAFPEHVDAAAWRRAIRLHVNDYLAPMMTRSAFGIAPFGLFSKKTGGDRLVGDLWYRYFMEPSSRWWVGINANLASTGVGLAKAARLLQEPRLAALAQRQLDWILGVNPFGASTMTGVGRNQPRQFVTGEFKPVTPLIDGAVMNGIGGTSDDQPDLKPGSWQTCEYWTPMVCYTMWLMSELSAIRVQGTAALEAQPPVVLQGERIKVEAAVMDGRL